MPAVQATRTSYLVRDWYLEYSSREVPVLVSLGTPVLSSTALHDHTTSTALHDQCCEYIFAKFLLSVQSPHRQPHAAELARNHTE